MDPDGEKTGSEEMVCWETLYAEVGERVFRLLHRMMGCSEEAADLTHDAFVRLHQAKRQFDQRGPLHAWAFRIAANVGRDALRSRRVRSDHARTVVRDAPIQLRSTPPKHSERSLGLKQALLDLHHSYRAVLLLHDVDGYTHQEIAEMLAIAVGTSKARLSRARHAMRLTLEETRQ